jgi:uncharacterized protein (DUF488 family)
MPQEATAEHKLVFTVGHGNRSLAELLGLLRQYGIQVLVDVRSFPTSRHAHFRRELLAPALKAAGVRYLWLGRWLGGFRRGGYQAWMSTADFQRGLAALEWLAAHRRLAFMCAERLFFRCHRRFIADRLTTRGWTVIHLLEAGRTYRHRPRGEQPRLTDLPPGA